MKRPDCRLHQTVKASTDHLVIQAEWVVHKDLWVALQWVAIPMDRRTLKEAHLVNRCPLSRPNSQWLHSPHMESSQASSLSHKE